MVKNYDLMDVHKPAKFHFNWTLCAKVIRKIRISLPDTQSYIQVQKTFYQILYESPRIIFENIHHCEIGRYARKFTLREIVQT